MRRKKTKTKENTPGQRITECYMFIAIDEDGDEGIPAIIGPDNARLPMIVSRRDLAERMATTASLLATMKGVKIELVRFAGQRELIETFMPANITIKP